MRKRRRRHIFPGKTGAGLLLLAAALLTSPMIGWAGQEAWEQRVEITAHRGNSSQAPENTLAAFESAIEAGTDWIETDVTQSKDGVLVLFHDEDMERLTGRQGKIWDFTFEELKGIRPESFMGPSFRDAGIPSLSEALDLCRGRAKMDLEIKVNGSQTADYVDRVVAMIREKGMEDQCMVTSFQYSVLERTKALAPGLKTGFITSTALTPGQSLAAADYVMLHVNLTDPQTVSQLQAQGKRVGAWTVNDYVSLEKCRQSGVDNVITDRPGTIF